MPGLDHLLLRQVWEMSRRNQAAFRATRMERYPQGTKDLEPGCPSWLHHFPRSSCLLGRKLKQERGLGRFFFFFFFSLETRG